MARIDAGQRVRLVDTEGNEAVDTFFFNAEDPRERYSAVDTVRRQRNVYLTTGTELVSNEDRTLLTIVDDTCGRHDTLGGACASESNTVRYAHDRKYMHSCRDNFLLALLNWNEDFSKRDLGPNINFFMNVYPRTGPALCRRHFRSGQVRRAGGAHGCAHPDLQLPSIEQSLQRL